MVRNKSVYRSIIPIYCCKLVVDLGSRLYYSYVWVLETRGSVLPGSLVEPVTGAGPDPSTRGRRLRTANRLPHTGPPARADIGTPPTGPTPNGQHGRRPPDGPTSEPPTRYGPPGPGNVEPGGRVRSPNRQPDTDPRGAWQRRTRQPRPTSEPPTSASAATGRLAPAPTPPTARPVRPGSRGSDGIPGRGAEGPGPGKGGSASFSGVAKLSAETPERVSLVVDDLSTPRDARTAGAWSGMLATCRRIRYAHQWFTFQPSRRSRATILPRPQRPKRLARTTTPRTRTGSSSGTLRSGRPPSRTPLHFPVPHVIE
jgi:hypothetical protein